MRETVFNSEIMASLKVAGAWAYKIADSPTSWTMRRTRFTPEKPCDILFCYQSLFGAIEGKQMKKFKSFGLRDLRPSQIAHLTEIVARGGRAFIFLNVRIKGKSGPIVRGRWTGSNYENRLLILDWEEWGPKLEVLPLSAKEIREFPSSPGKKGLFDLRFFLYTLERDHFERVVNRVTFERLVKKRSRLKSG